MVECRRGVLEVSFRLSTEFREARTMIVPDGGDLVPGGLDCVFQAFNVFRRFRAQRPNDGHAIGDLMNLEWKHSLSQAVHEIVICNFRFKRLNARSEMSSQGLFDNIYVHMILEIVVESAALRTIMEPI